MRPCGSLSATARERPWAYMEPSKKKEFIRTVFAAGDAKRLETLRYYMGTWRPDRFTDEERERLEQVFNFAYLVGMKNVLVALEEQAQIVI